MYGTSLNDVCIVHKLYYKNAHCAVAGIISTMVDKDQDDEQEDKTNQVDEFVASGRVIEFKTKACNTEQTFKEMLKSAGDLAAKVSIEGEIIDHIIMYGLAANFKKASAKLTILQLDFVNQQVVATESEEPVEMQRAMNWLLNSITLN